MEYKTEQIIFFRDDSFISNAICSYNVINYNDWGFSHVGIITKVLKDKVLIHEALSYGFTNKKKNGKPNYYLKEDLNNLIELKNIEIKTTKLKLKNLLKVANSYVGTPYGFLDILSIVIAMIFKFKISFTGSKKLICSEAVARLLYDCSNKKINLQEEFNKPYDFITPMDVYLSRWLNG